MFRRAKVPGPARRRFAVTSEGLRSHRDAYSAVIIAAEGLASSGPDEDRIGLLTRLEKAVYESTGYSNPPLYALACEVLGAGQSMVLDNTGPGDLTEAKDAYWAASRQGLKGFW
jgi:hypothetical protein